MPERNIITYVAGLGLSILGSLGLYNVRQTAALKKEVVSESLCGERRETYQKGMEDKIDAIGKNIDNLWGVVSEDSKNIAKIATVIEERGKRRD